MVQLRQEVAFHCLPVGDGHRYYFWGGPPVDIGTTSAERPVIRSDAKIGRCFSALAREAIVSLFGLFWQGRGPVSVVLRDKPFAIVSYPFWTVDDWLEEMKEIGLAQEFPGQILLTYPDEASFRILSWPMQFSTFDYQISGADFEASGLGADSCNLAIVANRTVSDDALLLWATCHGIELYRFVGDLRTEPWQGWTVELGAPEYVRLLTS